MDRPLSERVPALTTLSCPGGSGDPTFAASFCSVASPRVFDGGPSLRAGQQIHPVTQAGQMLGQHRIQLAGITESELPQQRSHR